MFIDVLLGMGLGVFGLLFLQVLASMWFSTPTLALEDWTDILVLDDQDTYGGGGYLIQVSPSELKRIEGGERLLDVILSTDPRWLKGEVI